GNDLRFSLLHNVDRHFWSVAHGKTRMREMKLQDLKSKSPVELLGIAEEHSVENASTMRKQELMFAILKQLAAKDIDIIGEGVVGAAGWLWLFAVARGELFAWSR